MNRRKNGTVRVGGDVLAVPSRIQRIDHGFTHGWQLRYMGTKLFSDGDGLPKDSLARAVGELYRRTKKHPPRVPSSVRTTALPHKQNTLPAGISGPVLVHKPSRAPYAEFKVSMPRRGAANAGTSVYIGTERTWSAERYDKALAKAKRIRTLALKQFRGEM
jgi:hypothetical protein